MDIPHAGELVYGSKLPSSVFAVFLSTSVAIKVNLRTPSCLVNLHVDVSGLRGRSSGVQSMRHVRTVCYVQSICIYMIVLLDSRSIISWSRAKQLGLDLSSSESGYFFA